MHKYMIQEKCISRDVTMLVNMAVTSFEHKSIKMISLCKLFEFVKCIK